MIVAPPWIRPNGLPDLTLSSACARHLAFVLEYSGGDILFAAQELDVSKTTVYRWLNGATVEFRKVGDVRRQIRTEELVGIS